MFTLDENGLKTASTGQNTGVAQMSLGNLKEHWLDFRKLVPKAEGRITGKWNWNNK